MKLSFGIVLAVVAVFSCSAASISAGPVSNTHLRKLEMSQETQDPSTPTALISSNFQAQRADCRNFMNGKCDDETSNQTPVDEAPKTTTFIVPTNEPTVTDDVFTPPKIPVPFGDPSTPISLSPNPQIPSTRCQTFTNGKCDDETSNQTPVDEAPKTTTFIVPTNEPTVTDDVFTPPKIPVPFGDPSTPISLSPNPQIPSTRCQTFTNGKCDDETSNQTPVDEAPKTTTFIVPTNEPTVTDDVFTPPKIPVPFGDPSTPISLSPNPQIPSTRCQTFTNGKCDDETSNQTPVDEAPKTTTFIVPTNEPTVTDDVFTPPKIPVPFGDPSTPISLSPNPQIPSTRCQTFTNGKCDDETSNQTPVDEAPKTTTFTVPKTVQPAPCDVFTPPKLPVSSENGPLNCLGDPALCSPVPKVSDTDKQIQPKYD